MSSNISQINTNVGDSLISEANDLFIKLFPICRSITGNGVRETLKILKELVDFNMHEISSGTQCYDWVVPDEWNIKDAYIKDSKGNKVIDFQENNLHVMGYSIPVDKKVSFDELKSHLHTLPKLPNAIPYRTSYYNSDWGFCLSHEQYTNLIKDQTFHVRIDSSLYPGSLTYGDGYIQGDSGKEYLISTYCCHPSLANDNLSGMVLWALLFRYLKNKHTRHSYRFLIVPETIGAIAYLAENENSIRNIDGGFIITTVAGPGEMGYKQSFKGDDFIDRVVRKTFAERNIQYSEYPFDIHGSDERQYSSPFFRIPVGTICKDKYYEYDYYHTSLDNLDFISPESLVETLDIYLSAIDMIESDQIYQTLLPKCEPMLSKRGFYPTVGGHIQQQAAGEGFDNLIKYKSDNIDDINGEQLKIIRLLMFYCDGQQSIFDIAEKFQIPMQEIHTVAELLRENNLLELI